MKLVAGFFRLNMPKTFEPSPKAKTPPPQVDDHFVTIEDVPVFDEHEADDGVVYGPEELEAIAENCNRRIRDTGDYVALTDGHTPDPDKHAEGKQPEVLGLAGPFTVGEIGNERPRKCIMARFRLFKDTANRAMRLPRRSVEVWQEKDPKDRYFDPIALLGAETPRRDLGMIYRYGKGGEKVKVCRYTATFPGGSNTFIPGETDRDRNAKENAMAISPEDIQQIVAALSELDVFKWAQDAMKAEQAQTMKNEAPAPDAGAVPPVAAPAPDADKDNMAKYMAEDPDMVAMRKYMEADDVPGAKTHMAAMSPEAREKMKKCYGMDQDGPDQPAKDFYAKASEDDKSPEGAEARGEELVAADKYRKEHADLKAKYSRLESEHKKVIADRDNLRREKVKAERYSKLTSFQTEGILVDPDKEIDEVVGMTEVQWEQHQGRIKDKYRRAPIGTVLPGGKMANDPSIAARTERSAKARRMVESGAAKTFDEAMSRLN